VQRLVVVLVGLPAFEWLGCAVLFPGAGRSYEGSSEAADGMCCALQERCIQMMYGVSQWQCFCGAGRMVMSLLRVDSLLHSQLDPTWAAELLGAGCYSVM